jgi:hypothetical protein
VTRVEAFGVHPSLLGRGLAAKIFLGERGPLVGDFGFLGEEDDAPVEALAPQGLGRLGAGEAAAHDDMRLAIRHGNSSV